MVLATLVRLELQVLVQGAGQGLQQVQRRGNLVVGAGSVGGHA